MENAMEQVLTTTRMLDLLEGSVAEAQPQCLQGVSALQALRNARANASGASQRVAELEKAMPEILALLDEVVDDVVDLASDVEGLSWGKVALRLRAGIKTKLSCETRAVRRAVCLPLLVHRLKQVVDASEEACTAVMDWAVKNEFLAPNDPGFALFRGRKYIISCNFGLDDEDRAYLRTLFAEACRKAKSAEPLHESAHAESPAVAPVKPKPVTANRAITPGQAWAGMTGTFDLHVPPANGNDKGGILHLECQDGGFLFVAKAGNGFADLECLSIPLYALKDGDGNVRDGLKLVEPDLRPGDKVSWRITMERLGKALQRGFASALQVKEDMDPHDFLATDAVGDSLLVFNGEFNWNPPAHPEDQATFNDITLRFARRMDGQIALIEILTPKAKAYLKEVVDEYHDPRERFGGMKPLFVTVFLRAVYGQVVLGKSY